MKKFKDDFEFGGILSEQEIAWEFSEDSVDQVRYCLDNAKWYYFDGTRWKEDERTIQLRRIIGLTTKEYFNKNLLRCANEEQRLALQKFITKSLRSGALKRLLADAEIIPKLQVSMDEFDRHLTLLVSPNGTVDLSTGELIDSRPEHFITKRAATKFLPELEPAEACSRFLAFLDEITDGDEELKEHILKILAYCLTGLSTEQKIYLFFGPGANGKTVLLEVIRAVLGTEIVIHVDSKTLVKNGRVIREDVARFSGARLATCSEIGKCDTLDEPLIKGLSGGDRQVSRKLRENSTEFENQAKIIIATNYLPDLEGTDDGIARRIEVIPFKMKLHGAPDPLLKEKLIEEREGILALLVKYAKDVITNGVGDPPPAVQEETDRYIKFGNSVKCFLHDCCVVNPGKRITPSQSYDAYKEYCNHHRVKAVNKNEFPRLLKMMGYEQKKSGDDRYWLGFELVGNAISSTEDSKYESSNAKPDADGVGNTPMLSEEGQESNNSEENPSLHHSSEGDTDTNDQ